MEVYKFLESFFVSFISILGEMSPYLLLGFFFAGLLYAFMPKQKIDKYFNGHPIKSSFLASVFGIPLPLCSCGVIPTGAAFYKNGASKAGTVSFLISTPQTGVDSILATFSLLGLPFAVIRPIAAFISGITGGAIVGLSEKNIDSHDFSNKKEVVDKKAFSTKVREVFKYGFVEFIQDISKWLVIGLLLAAVISALIPDNFFEILSLPPILQMILILIVSIPLYICATGTIPLAAVLILKGISPGAAFVLLMAGPATNAATITMIGKVLGKKSLIIYLSTIIVFSLIFGLIIDYILPIKWFVIEANEHLAHMHNELGLIQILSGITMVALIVNGYIQKKLSKRKTVNNNINFNSMKPIKTIKVEGMTCNHCKANVENNLNKLDFIDEAVVNLDKKTVDLAGANVDLVKVKEVVEGLGYKYNS